MRSGNVISALSFGAFSLVGCAGGFAPIPPPSVVAPADQIAARSDPSRLSDDSRIIVKPNAPPGLTVLYSFKGPPDGSLPKSGLTDVNGELFGTTQLGGFGFGTVFKVDGAGAETVVYRFRGPRTDGLAPLSSVIDINGELYGTTPYGGAGKDGSPGTVFKVSPGGAESVVYSFNGPKADGAGPEASLLDVNGELYGTTLSGGAYAAYGTVFRVDPADGAEKVLHSFKGPVVGDGADPNASLTAVGGDFYGTTSIGGDPAPVQKNCALGCGTVFKVTPSGAESILYRFKGGADGEYPNFEGLTSIGGTLYGTTGSGGSGCKVGCGTIFKITTSGQFTTVYRFKGGIDGSGPSGNLTYSGGVFFGATAAGGGTGCGGFGCGTIFSVSPSGKENVLYRFKGGASNGEDPNGDLLDIGGRLYGTAGGGAHNLGIVFALTT
jgi:uncharacterized repeat protein (TIGR03803 family)